MKSAVDRGDENGAYDVVAYMNRRMSDGAPLMVLRSASVFEKPVEPERRMRVSCVTQVPRDFALVFLLRKNVNGTKITSCAKHGFA